MGFDPTTTGSGGLCLLLPSIGKSAPCPSWATDPQLTQLFNLIVIYNSRLYTCPAQTLPSLGLAIVIIGLLDDFILCGYTLYICV